MTKRLQSFLLAAPLALLLLSAAGHVSAQSDTSGTGYKPYTGVQASIEKYLCAPSAPGQPVAGQGNRGNAFFGNTGAPTNTVSSPSSGDLFTCINKLYRFAIVVAVTVAMLFVAVAGYLYMSADGSAEQTGKAKTYILNVVVALLILLGGNLLLKTINPDLIRLPSVDFSSYRNGVPAATGTEVTIGGGAVSPGGGTQAGAACLFSGVNTCQPVAWGAIENGKFVAKPARGGECGSPTRCSQYAGAIARQAAAAGINQNMLKAIMARESQCDISQHTNVSFGLMQMGVTTANNTSFKQACNLGSITVTSDWLMQPANAEASICLAAQYVKYLAGPSVCGTKPENIFAGYSATSACSPSVDCASDRSCTGDSAVRKWECIYDNPQHTVCNGQPTFLGSTGGFNESRYAVMGKMYCYQQPGF